ncbi:MAG: hypothetical protein ABW167_17845 [Baekduia sp.]
MVAALVVPAVVLAVVLTSRPHATTRSPDVALPAAARAAISERIGRDDPAFAATARGDGAWSMVNRPARVRAVLRRSGGEVVADGAPGVRVRLAGIVADGRSVAVGVVAPRARHNRVEYRHAGVTEWYANGPAGVEQGFRVDRPRDGGGRSTLSVDLALGGAGVAARRDPRGGVTIATRRGPVLRYGDLWAQDAAGRPLAARLEPVAGGLRLAVDVRGARYPVTIDPVYQAAQLLASNGDNGDFFGWRIAMSGDTVVVGAPYSHLHRGGVYVFTKPAAGGWVDGTEVARLTASDGAGGWPGDSLGYSVAFDGETIVAGAVEATVGGHTQQGAVYVFTRPAGGWHDATQTAKLTLPSGVAYENFGFNVAVLGDTIAATVPNHRVDGFNLPLITGAIYVFKRPAGGWAGVAPIAKLSDSSGTDGPQALAMDGTTIVSGTARAGASLTRPGVNVFVKPAGGWVDATETARLRASDAGDYDAVGSSVALSGDTIVAGNPNADAGAGSYQGAAYVWVKPPGGWVDGTERAKLTAADGQVNDSFGGAVDVEGPRIVVGAAWADYARGKAYVFDRPSGGWATTSQAMTLTTADGARVDRLGDSVAVRGSTIVAGAPERQGPQHSSALQGAVYAWTDDSTTPAPPVIAATAPASPGSDATPRVSGTAEAGATIRIYRGPECVGLPAAIGTAAAFASPGLAVVVPSEATSLLRATQTDRAGNVSPCSVARTYVEDSTPPETALLSGPDGATDDDSPTFTFASSEPNGTFSCRVDDREPRPCPSPVTLESLGEGAHVLEVRARDAAGNEDPSPAIRHFVVDTSPPVASLIASTPTPLTAESVQFDASGSTDPPAGTIVRYQWDLDGDGAFETDTGSVPTVARLYAVIDDIHASVRVTDAFGRSGVASVDLSVRKPPPPGPTGVSIDHGSLYTRSPLVQVDVVWPARAKTMTVSNDGGFRTPTMLAVAGRVSWRLASTGPERLPKTVYVRFDDNPRTTYTDDIILDQTRPRVRSATFARTAAGTQVRIDATDNISGVQSAQIRYNRGRTRTVRYRDRVSVPGHPSTVEVRVTDGAGNVSRWKTAAAQARRDRHKRGGR